MATCKVIPAVYPKPEPITPAQYQLTLSREEAATLKIILNNIGGHHQDTLRCYAETISECLPEYDTASSIPLLDSTARCMYFAIGSRNTDLFQEILKSF